MTVNGICLDGKWTERQARAVLAVVNRGYRKFHVIDVTTHNDPVHWFIIRENSEEHELPKEPLYRRLRLW